MIRIALFLIMITGSFLANSQSVYKKIRTKLPFSNTEKDYYVKQVNNLYVLNGDVIVGHAGQTLMMYQSNNSNGSYIWPRGDVPVKIDRNMLQKKTINGANLYENALKAIATLNKETNLRLVPHSNQKDYIRIMYTVDTGYGGLSPVGRKGGEQIIYITRESEVKTIIHELLHSLGFWHEQSRHDRDNYIVIDTSNIEARWHYAFQIEPGSASTPYDYNSIMHYGEFAFAKDKKKPTIRCKQSHLPSGAVCSVGGYGLTEQDIAGINASYFFNKDIAKRDYASLMPYDEYLPTAKLALPKATDVGPKAYRAVDKPVPNGIYMIYLPTTKKYLTITGASSDNGALLEQWDNANAANQKFEIKTIGDGLYTIKALHSNKYLSVTDASKEFRATICQWDFANLDNQKFYLQYSAEAKGYCIKNKLSEMYWQILSLNRGEKIVQEPELREYFLFEATADIPASYTKPIKMKPLNSPRQINVIKKGNN